MAVNKLSNFSRIISHTLTSLHVRVSRLDGLAVVAFSLCIPIYFFLGWQASGAETRWQLDIIDGMTIFYGDDAYRYFLARAAWIDPDISLQGFVLPVALALDGILASLMNDSLVLMRFSHAVISVFSTGLLYAAGRRLKVPMALMLPSSLILALMPLYGYVSLSFYGEFWLASAVSIAIWAMVSGRTGLFVCIISVMPLLRPEGIYFFFMGGIFLLFSKKPREFLLSYLPGGLYFFVLLFSENGLQGSFYWRSELRDFLNMIEFSSNPQAMFNTFNNIWLLGGVVGLSLKSARPLWPFSIAAFFWLCLVFFIVYAGLGDYEPRYTVPALPVIALGWGLLLAWIATRLREFFPRRLLRTVLISLCAFVLFENLLQMHAINQIAAYYRNHTKLPDFDDQNVRSAILLPKTHQEVEDTRFMADFAAHLIQENPRINALVVSDVSLFYFLSPALLSDGVRVAFSATYWPFFKRLLGNELMAVFPGGAHYGYFSLSAPEKGSSDLLLYADYISASEHDVGWVRGKHQLHLFEYQLSQQPKVDFRGLPVIDPLSIPWHEMAPHL